MKAAFKKQGTAYIKEVEPAELRPQDIRVKVEACGVCGTDLHRIPGAADDSSFGHEIAGEIIELGPAVKDLSVGQKIALDSSTPCGYCAECRDARQELCKSLRSFWGGTLGFAEQIVAPDICALPCDGLTPEVACLQEPLGVAIDLVRLSDIEPESNVLIIGPGAIGLMTLALVRRAGARRVFMSGFKRRTARVKVAEQFGADAFIDPDETPLTEYDFGCPIDRVLVTAPPRTLNTAFEVAVKGGIVSFVGIEYGEGAFCTFDVNKFHFKKLQLRASFASPALFGPKAIRYLQEGVVDGAALVSHRFPLDRIAEAVQTAASEPTAIKVVVMP